MTIGICGAGTMGSGIAVACIQNGHKALVYDVTEEALQRAQSFVDKQLNKAVEREKMSSEAAETARGMVSFVQDLEDLVGCEFLIEAILENKDIKDKLYNALEKIAAPDTIVATNTSSISVTSLAASLQHPERFVGMHFFNPAHVMKLVEVIRGSKSSETTVEKTVELVRSLKKSPAITKDVPGFIVNRVARNFYNEAMRICSENAASIEQVDTIMKGAGFRMGPFELMDLIGVDTNLEVTKSVWQQYFYEPRFEPSLMQQHYVDAKLHGRKTGEGFYKYDQD